MDRKLEITQPRPAIAIAAHIRTETPALVVLFAGAMIALMLLLLPAFAQTDQPRPANASAKSYGEG